MNILANNPVRFSDIERKAAHVDQALALPNPDPRVVEYWSQGGSADSAAYKLQERLRSLALRAGTANPTVSELQDSVTGKLESRNKLAKVAAYTAFAAALGVMGVGLLQTTGAADLGTLGTTLASCTDFLPGIMSGVGVAIKAGHTLATRDLRADQKFLGSLNQLVEVERGMQTA